LQSIGSYRACGHRDIYRKYQTTLLDISRFYTWRRYSDPLFHITGGGCRSEDAEHTGRRWTYISRQVAASTADESATDADVWIAIKNYKL